MECYNVLAVTQQFLLFLMLLNLNKEAVKVIKSKKYEVFLMYQE